MWPFRKNNVIGEAWVSKSALIGRKARVRDRATVYDNAWVADRARVSGEACIKGDAVIKGYAWVCGAAIVADNACVQEHAEVLGYARVSGGALVRDRATVCGHAQVNGGAYVSGKAYVEGHARIGHYEDLAHGELTYYWTMQRELEASGSKKLRWGLRYGCVQMPLEDWTPETIKALCDEHDEGVLDELTALVAFCKALAEVRSWRLRVQE